MAAKRFLWLLLTLAGTLIMAAANVPPSDAISNLAKWADYFGLTVYPDWLRFVVVDKWAIRIGFVAAVVSFALYILPEIADIISLNRSQRLYDQWTRRRLNLADEDGQKFLIESLHDHLNYYAYVRIVFTDEQYKELAETLASVFGRAGWRVENIQIPLESYVLRHRDGIEIKGMNENLVASVRQYLARVGIGNTRASIEAAPMRRDDPERVAALNFIQITIGRH
jgi:hypothetical protein